MSFPSAVVSPRPDKFSAYASRMRHETPTRFSFSQPNFLGCAIASRLLLTSVCFERSGDSRNAASLPFEVFAWPGYAVNYARS
jgi:hypothetical protein